MAEQIRKDVAVFIDFENVYVSVRDKLDANPNFEIIMDRCNELGRVILARAYADWYRYPRITSAFVCQQHRADVCAYLLLRQRRWSDWAPHQKQRRHESMY
jgi:hypothetical protein